MRITQPTNPDEHRSALAMLLARPETSQQDLDVQIDTLRAYAQSYGLSLEHCLVASEDERAVAASLCVDSPGRIASIFLPPGLERARERLACRLLLSQMTDRGASRGLMLLQAMLDPESAVEATVLADSGFRRVARLLYLERDLALPLGREARAPEPEWESYNPRVHAEFVRVLRDTYKASLDCPALNGRRSIEDVLATHRAAGRYDPRGWLLARQGDEPIGLVLLNDFPERMASEVVYMGVLSGFRHRGYGASLLRRAIGLARERGNLTLALSVDEGNGPARRLYDAFGFQQTVQKDAWICFLEEERPGDAAGT